jgi:hypothetical protein
MSELSDPSSAVHGPLGHEERDISIRPSSWHKKLLSNFSKYVDSKKKIKKNPYLPTLILKTM